MVSLCENGCRPGKSGPGAGPVLQSRAPRGGLKHAKHGGAGAMQARPGPRAGAAGARATGARRAGWHQPITNSGWPYSTAWPFSTRISLITPALSHSISLSSFMASMMQTVWPSLTVSPTFTNGAAPGDGAR